jgi:hypothetical protein
MNFRSYVTIESVKEVNNQGFLFQALLPMGVSFDMAREFLKEASASVDEMEQNYLAQEAAKKEKAVEPLEAKPGE